MKTETRYSGPIDVDARLSSVCEGKLCRMCPHLEQSVRSGRVLRIDGNLVDPILLLPLVIRLDCR